jgi:hypothetical protein
MFQRAGDLTAFSDFAEFGERTEGMTEQRVKAQIREVGGADNKTTTF